MGLAAPLAPAAAEPAEGLTCLRTEHQALMDPDRPLDDDGNTWLKAGNYSYRYNSLILYEGVPALDHYDADISRTLHLPELHTAHRRHGDEYRAMIDARLGLDPAVTVGDRQSAWYDYSRRYRGMTVFYPPIHLDGFRQCGKSNQPLDGEYALIEDEVSPRVRGALCAERPVIVFDDAKATHRRIQSASRIVQDFAKSTLLAGQPLNPADYELAVTDDRRLERRLVQVLNLIAHQCDSAPAEIGIVLQRQDISLAAMRADLPQFVNLYEGALVQTEDGLFLENRNVSPLAAGMFQNVQNRQAAAERRARAIERRHDSIAVGAALVGGIMAGMEVFSPCHDPERRDTADAVLLVCQ
ncbi:MAG: hypothetical protein VX874_11315 [Pseudomonadota bacterium]|nr:hypothetical protein [Pseudomonadota bacterium]